MVVLRYKFYRDHNILFITKTSAGSDSNSDDRSSIPAQKIKEV